MASEARKATEMRAELSELNEAVRRQQALMGAIARHLGVEHVDEMEA